MLPFICTRAFDSGESFKRLVGYKPFSPIDSVPMLKLVQNVCLINQNYKFATGAPANNSYIPYMRVSLSKIKF